MTPTTIGISLAALCLASLGVMCWLAFTAPHGHEDSAGFHLDEHSDYDGDA